MFLSREIDIKLYQNTKIHMQFCLKVVVLNKSNSTKRNQSKNDDIPQEPENLRFAPF